MWVHFLVAFGDQAEASLKIWQNLLFDDVFKVGSLAHGGYSKGDFATLRQKKMFVNQLVKQGVRNLGAQSVLQHF